MPDPALIFWSDPLLVSSVLLFLFVSSGLLFLSISLVGGIFFFAITVSGFSAFAINLSPPGTFSEKDL